MFVACVQQRGTADKGCCSCHKFSSDLWLLGILTEFYQTFVDESRDPKSDDSDGIVKKLVVSVFTLSKSIVTSERLRLALKIKGCKCDSLTVVLVLVSFEDRTLDECVVEALLICVQFVCNYCLVFLGQPISAFLWIGRPALRLLIYFH